MSKICCEKIQCPHVLTSERQSENYDAISASDRFDTECVRDLWLLLAHRSKTLAYACSHVIDLQSRNKEMP